MAGHSDSNFDRSLSLELAADSYSIRTSGRRGAKSRVVIHTTSDRKFGADKFLGRERDEGRARALYDLNKSSAFE